MSKKQRILELEARIMILEREKAQRELEKKITTFCEKFKKPQPTPDADLCGLLFWTPIVFGCIVLDSLLNPGKKEKVEQKQNDTSKNPTASPIGNANCQYPVAVHYSVHHQQNSDQPNMKSFYFTVYDKEGFQQLKTEINQISLLMRGASEAYKNDFFECFPIFSRMVLEINTEWDKDNKKQ